MENLVKNNVKSAFWKGKRVLITGHTGFKGAWLSLWLQTLGAQVYGFGLEDVGSTYLYSELNLRERLVSSRYGDIRSKALVDLALEEAAPDIVFHMAAQSLVRESYINPVETWDVNVMGTIRLLEAVRKMNKKCAMVVVTTDKVYENRDQGKAFSETDPLGGHDPYSSSKAATELAVASWRDSFLHKQGSTPNLRVSTARAGNVIGGGDFSKDRIVPDVMRSLYAREPIKTRNPQAIRPWQHVLEPLSGYLRLAELLYFDDSGSLESAFNFGPELTSCVTVAELLVKINNHWNGEWISDCESSPLHEANTLVLDSAKASRVLAWRAQWSLDETVSRTVAWYYSVMHREVTAAEACLDDITTYTNL